MQITIHQLNEVATLLGTTDKNIVISATIRTLVDEGLTVQAAFDAVFGEGAYQCFAGQIYDALQPQ